MWSGKDLEKKRWGSTVESVLESGCGGRGFLLPTNEGEVGGCGPPPGFP